ncbi:ferredoxin [Pseudomonas corrugata]|uniref:ferredoxin n=1 Tax=Pseudomonas corrugata TaxID=47879 RepID=UPI001586C3C7|nr:ferredoxin [Pseudomonas corrugata]MCI0996992.1 ferredoxin [Pseudomonas corrugata]NUT64695.1 ferredoxin [Pseudomonas corrugata]
METSLQPGAASAAPRLKLVVDRSACCAYGLCAEICPEIYKLDDNGIVYVEQELVPLQLEGRAREGAESCPQGAIEVLELTPD